MTETWWLYMIECKGGGIYTGIAKDVEARYEKHVKGKGSTYTKINPPVKLICALEYSCHREAAVVEYKLKRLNRCEKLQWAKTVGIANCMK
jgi:putative endonuclease